MRTQEDIIKKIEELEAVGYEPATEADKIRVASLYDITGKQTWYEVQKIRSWKQKTGGRFIAELFITIPQTL